MEQVLIATDLYVHNQTNHIVFVNIVWWLSAAEPNLGIPAEPDLLLQKKVSRLDIVCNIGKPYGWHTH